MIRLLYYDFPPLRGLILNLIQYTNLFNRIRAFRRARAMTRLFDDPLTRFVQDSMSQNGDMVIGRVL